MADLKYSDDILAEAEEAQEEIFNTDPLAPAQMDIEPVGELSYGEVETPEGDRLLAEDFNEGQPPERPDAEEPALPFGDYDPEDIRMQVVQGRYGRQDGNYYEFVRERFQSGDNPPTAAELTKASQEAAEVAYQQVYGRSPKNMRDPDFQELTLQFEKLYGQQRDLMSERQMLTPGEEAENPTNATINRVAATFKSVGLEPEETFEFYEQQLNRQGKFDDDMTPEMREQRVIDTMVSDLKAQGMEAADLFRLRAQLQGGNWEGLRRRPEGPSATPGQIAEGQEFLADQEAAAEAAEPSLMSRLFAPSGDDEGDDSQTLAADAPFRDNGENPWADTALAASQERYGLGPELPLPEVGIDWMTPERQAEIRRTSPGFGTNLRAAAIQVEQAIAGVPLSAALRDVSSLGEAALVLNRDVTRPRIEAEILSLQDSLRAEGGSANAAAANERLDTLRDQLVLLRESEGVTDAQARENFDQAFDDTAERMASALPRVLELSARMRDAPASPETEAMFQRFQDDGFVAGVSDFASSPMQITADLVTRNAGQIGAAIGVGAATGLVAGPGAGVGAGAMVGGMTEQSLSVVQDVEEWLQDKNVDVSDPEAVRAALEEDPEGLQGILANSLRRAATITIGGFAAAPVARTLAGGAGVTSAAGREALEAVAEGGTELVAGGTPADAFVEAVAGGATSVVAGSPDALAERQAPEDMFSQAGESTEALTPEERESADALINDLLQPTDTGPAIAETRLVTDAPEGAGTIDAAEIPGQELDGLAAPTTEDIVSAAASVSPAREQVRTMALEAPDAAVETVEQVEAAAGSIVPTQEEVTSAEVSLAQIEELQGQVDVGLSTLSKFDRDALATVTQSARAIIDNADSAFVDARNAVSDALGADIDAAAPPPPSRGRRQSQQQRRAAQERQTDNAVARLRSMGNAPTAPDASLIGVLAGLPRGTIYALSDRQVLDDSAAPDTPIGSSQMREDLLVGSRADNPHQMISSLQGVRDSLSRYEGWLTRVGLEGIADNTQQARAVAMSRSVEGEPLRQLIRDRAFQGADQSMIDQLDLVTLASADDATLNRWATASKPEELADFPSGSMLSDARPGIPATRATRDAAATNAVAGTPSGNAGIARKIARAVIDTRAARKKTRRAIEQVDKSINVLGVVSGLTDTNTDVGQFVRSIRASVQGGATDGAALRQALRDHAPSLLEDGVMPIREMAGTVGRANAALPADLRVERDPLARAYQSTLSTEELFGQNWKSRRISRQADQRSVQHTVEQVMALGVDSDPIEVQQAREELGAMAVAEHILQVDQIPALREALANLDGRTTAARALKARIADAEPRTDEEYAEMLVNEFALDEDAAVAVTVRGREMAAAASGDGDAIRSVNEGADELLGTIRFHTGEDRGGWYEGVDPTAETIEGWPQTFPSAEQREAMVDALMSTDLAAPGVRVVPGFGLERVQGYVEHLARTLNFRGGITLVPVEDMRPSGVDLSMVAGTTDADKAELRALGEELGGLQGRRIDGFSFNLRENAYVIGVNTADPMMSDGDLAAVAAHEFGHAATQALLVNARRRSPKAFEMLTRAYENAGYGMTLREAGYFPSEAVAADQVMTNKFGNYANEFHEWFAGRVGEYATTEGVSPPTGLAQRLMHSIARTWRRIVASLRGDNVELGRVAIGRIVQQAVRNGLPLDTFVSENNPAARAAERDILGIPADRRPTREQRRAQREAESASILGRAGGTEDVRGIPLAQRMHMMSREGDVDTPLSTEQQDSIKRQFVGLTTDTGVKLRIVNPERVSVPDRLALGNRGVAYRPPPKAGLPAVIVVHPGRYNSTDAAIKDIEVQLVTQHGMAAALGADAATRLNIILANPKDANLSSSAKRSLTKLRNKTRRSLTIDGIPPADAVVAQAMLAQLSEQYQSEPFTEASNDALGAVQSAISLGRRIPLDPLHMAALFTSARHFGAGVQTPASGTDLTKRQEGAVTTMFSESYAQARSRDQRQERAADTREVLNRSKSQRVYDAMFDYMMPVIRIGRIGRQIGGDVGERLSHWATELNWRSKMYQSEFNRVVVTQNDIHSNFDANLDDMAGQLGYSDRAELRSHINLFSVARAAVERNENTALVYGRLDNEALEADRLEILSRYDEAVQVVQGDNRRRSAESFAEVRDLRTQQIAELRGLLLDPNAPDTPVRRQILASREGRSPYSSEGWADTSGATTRVALEVVSRLESNYGGNWMRAFKASGTDGRIRRLIDQTYENRIMSGVYGASGELYISRLGLQHHTPMRGMGVSEGVIRHEREGLGLADHDVAYYGSMQRSTGTRLAPANDLRRFSDRFKLTDVLDVGAQDYFSSIREMTTNHQVGALVGLSQALDDAGVAAEFSDPDRRPITVSRELPFLVWQDPDNPSTQYELPAPGRERVINPQILRARQVVSEDGKTGSLLHALPNGNYQIIQVNDPAIYKAMTFRFQRGTGNVASDAILRSLGNITRVNARTFTSWALPFTTFRAFTRDLQENADVLLFERGVSAARTATLPVRAARMIVPLERFFQSGPDRRQELIRKWSAKRSHPMNGFARRWQAGSVQVFAQQLELATDRVAPEGVAGQLFDIAGRLYDRLSVPLDWAEAHADAMENSVRQAASDIIEAQLIRDGATPEEAARTAYDDVINVLNFGQRSAVGEALAPVHTFAQTALTGTHVLLDRRLWAGGEPPIAAGAGLTDDGQLQGNVDWSAIHRSLNYPRLASWSAVGFLNTMFASFAMGLWTGEGEDDELDGPARERIEKIKGKVFGPAPEVEARSLVLQAMDKSLRYLLDDPDAEADDLRMLRPTSVYSGLLLPWQDDEMQARAPISYGVQSLGVNVGQAAALLALGHEPSAVIGGLTNAVLRNVTPLDAPYNDQPPTNMQGFMQLIVPSLASTAYEIGYGQTLDGIRLSADPFTDVGAQAGGWAATPGMTGATQLNELFTDMGLYIQQTGNDLGLPFAGTLAQKMIPSGRRVENLADYIPLIGAPMADAFREVEKQMLNNGGAGEPLFSFGDALKVGTRTILEDGGFISMDPGRNAQSDYYREATWSGWKDLAGYKQQLEEVLTPSGREFDDDTYEKYRASVNSITGQINQELGKRKDNYRQAIRAMTRAETPQARAAAAAEADTTRASMDAIYREAANALKTMRESVDRTAPNIVPAD